MEIPHQQWTHGRNKDLLTRSGAKGTVKRKRVSGYTMPPGTIPTDSEVGYTMPMRQPTGMEDSEVGYTMPMRQPTGMEDSEVGYTMPMRQPTGMEENHVPSSSELRRSERIKIKNLCHYLSIIQSFNTNIELSKLDPRSIIIPRNHRQATRSPEWEHWSQAEKAEIDGIIKAGCVIPEYVPRNSTIIDAKWVYDIKTNSLQEIIRFKARLSARGDQISDIDLGNLFSPVVSWMGIRYFLALTVLLALKPLQLDFDLAYLNADLEEVIYMRPPPGYELPQGQAWRLVKSLYGLKQSGKNWHKLLHKLLTSAEFNFRNFTEDPCLFSRIEHGTTTILFIYVDDVYIASSDVKILRELPEKLMKHYPLKVLGIPQQLLGVKIEWGEDFKSVHISIGKLINTLLYQYQLLNAIPHKTPMKPGQYFEKDDRIDPNILKKDSKLKKMHKDYMTIIGTCIFICYTCRPDICYAVNVLCRAMAHPSHKHYEAALWLLRYLAGTKDAGITYNYKGSMKPKIYTDADNGTDYTRRTCVAHIMFFAGGPISWQSKFIKEYSLSTCESEIRAIAAALPAIQSALYIKKIIAESFEYGLLVQVSGKELKIYISAPIEIFEDNKAAIDWSLKTTNTQRMRHIEKSLYWIKSKTADNTIRMIFTESEYQLADIGTKPVYSTTFVPMIQRIMTYFG
jgi:hypothetical protein